MNSQKIIKGFFIGAGVVLIIGLAIMGIAFAIMKSNRLKNPEIDDENI